MNAPQSPDANAYRIPGADADLNLLDWLVALFRRKKLVFGLPVACAVCASLVSLSMPNAYKATTKILPSQQTQSNAVAMVNRLGGFVGTAPGALNIHIPIELHISMLKSRTVAENLIQRFDLKKAYRAESLEAAQDILERNTRIRPGKDGLITIEVEDEQPDRAAQIANAYVDEVINLTKRMALTEASHRRLFYERVLRSTKDKLIEAKAMLKMSEADRRNMAGLDRKGRAVAETAARLRAQISAKEMQLGAMEAFVSFDNQTYNLGHQEIGALRADLARIESTTPSTDGLAAQVVTENIRILRDAIYYEMLYELLAQQYEAARLDEAKDSSIIQVLDKAMEPGHHVKPKRTIITMGSALAGLLIAAFWVLFFDVIRIRQRLSRLSNWGK